MPTGNTPCDKDAKKIPWYYRPATVWIALFCVGPLALPLVILTPAFSRTVKIIIVALVILMSIWMWDASMKLYNLLMQELRELQAVM